MDLVKQIFVVGHSFGDVDMIYFSAIKNRVKNNTVWNIYYYRQEERTEFRNKALGLGIDQQFINIIQAKDFFQ